MSILQGMEPGSLLRSSETPIASARQHDARPRGDHASRERRSARQQPRRGAIVAPLEFEDIQEVQSIRGCGIEGLAARLGAVRDGRRASGAWPSC
ncbi:MAG: hypothetical protein R3C32_04115 [Chloroflexota bacterium]